MRKSSSYRQVRTRSKNPVKGRGYTVEKIWIAGSASDFHISRPADAIAIYEAEEQMYGYLDVG